MKQDFEHFSLSREDYQYESPSMEIIEIELEGALLQMSGEDGSRQDW